MPQYAEGGVVCDGDKVRLAYRHGCFRLTWWCRCPADDCKWEGEGVAILTESIRSPTGSHALTTGDLLGTEGGAAFVLKTMLRELLAEKGAPTIEGGRDYRLALRIEEVSHEAARAETHEGRAWGA